MLPSVFLQKKTKITLDMARINKYITDSGFLGLIFGGRGFEFHKRNYFDNNIPDDYYIPNDDDMTNILISNVLNLFNNLQTMVIAYVQSHPFSLHQLVLLLTQTKIEKVEILAVDDNSWLFYLWGNSSSSFIKAYINEGYSIEYDGDFVISIKLL